MELHDRDPPNLGEGVEVPHGVARFSLAQMLKANVPADSAQGNPPFFDAIPGSVGFYT